MKKSAKLILTLAVFTAVSNLAFADGNAFTPLNFDDSSTAAPVSVVKPSTPSVEKSSNPFSHAISKAKSKPAYTAENGSGEVPIGNDNIQNAILQLDNAQVGIRNDLVNYKAKYSEIDAQYKLVKNQRTMLHRQVVATERRIRQIDRSKDALRRNML